MNYQRQIQVIGEKAQEKLSKSTAVIVGVGGIGTIAAELLARSGVNLVLIDFDFVDETNLQRQMLFDNGDIGKTKTSIAAEKLKKINPKIKIKAHQDCIRSKNVDLLKEDIILDCTDNFDARYLINQYCVKNKIPLVIAAAVEQRCLLFSVVGKPCFECIFSSDKIGKTCCEVGVLSTVTTIVGALQANEAIRILIGEKPSKDLLYINAKNISFDSVKVKPSKKCRTCKGDYYLLANVNKW